jgi:predicted Zn-dependent protease
MSRAPRIALVLALALAAAGCITRAQEAKIGEDESKQVEQQLGLVRDPALEAYLGAVGARLTAVSDLPEGPWHFLVVDQPDPNAFALPGGYVYVTRGLLVLTNSEDELAGVVGHEIAHVIERHSAKRFGAAVLTAPISIATGLAGFAVGLVAPVLGRVVAGTGEFITGGLVLATYSREQERQADELGQTLAAKAGYDPAGITDFLRTLDRDTLLETGRERRFHFFDSHPLTPDRIEQTAARARELTRAPGSPVATGRAEFLAHLEGLLVGDDPAQGVFEDGRFLHPDLDLTLTFPTGWETRNTADAVGAISPPKDAVVVLRIAASGSSLDEVLAQATKEQSDLHFERFEIGGLPAARTRVARRGQVVDVTLIAYGGDVYGVVGQCREEAAAGYAKVFGATAASFRALRPAERDAIRESRLRVRAARAGETPAAIVARTGSTWDADHAAVANEVPVGEPFAAGFLVKLALPQPYTPRKG